jgi:ribosome-binding factor A
MIDHNKAKNIKKLRREAEILKNLMIVLHKIIIKKDILSGLSFTKVNVTTDGSFIMVFVHSLGGEEIAKNAISYLTSYKKQIYHELCQQLQYRRVPHLKFLYDEQQDKVNKINTLIDKLALDEA